jgi:hypothetical protein
VCAWKESRNDVAVTVLTWPRPGVDEDKTASSRREERAGEEARKEQTELDGVGQRQEAVSWSAVRTSGRMRRGRGGVKAAGAGRRHVCSGGTRGAMAHGQDTAVPLLAWPNGLSSRGFLALAEVCEEVRR